MEANIKETDGLKKKLEFIVPLEQVDKSFSTQLQKIQRSTKIPGFREGKAPLEAVKKNFYQKAWNAVMDDLFRSFYPQALDEIKLNPAGQAKLLDIQLEEKKDCKFLVELEVHPKVEVKNYLNLKVKKIDTQVTEQHVQDSLDKLKESFTNYTDSLEDRPVKKGDCVTLSMEAFADSKKIKEFSQEELLLNLGENKLASDFDNNLMGLKIGQEKTFNFQLPKDHVYKNLAAKSLSFHVKLKGLKTKKEPDLNDEFAKKFKLETFNELKSRIKKDLEEVNKQKAKETMENEVIDKFVAANPLDLPTSVIQDQKKKLIENAKKRLEGYKMKPAEQETWIKQQDAHFEKEAKFSVQASYLMEKLIEDLKITADPKDIEKSLKESFPDKKPEQMEEELKKNNYWSHFVFNLTRQKVIAHLLEKAELSS